MASPQCENGYTRIANELLDALCALRICGQELRVVLFVARKTYGYQKKQDKLSYGQIAAATNIPRKRVAEHVKTLCNKNILSILNNGDRKPLTMWINKDYEQWQSVPKKGDIPNNGDRTIPKNGDRTIPNIGDHKRKKERKKLPSDFLEFSRNFLEYQQKQLGNGLVKITDAKIRAGAEAIDKLVRIDGYSLQNDIRPALAWAVHDDFWAAQIRGLAGLRKKGNNGELKFNNLYAKFISSKPKKVVDLPY